MAKIEKWGTQWGVAWWLLHAIQVLYTIEKKYEEDEPRRNLAVALALWLTLVVPTGHLALALQVLKSASVAIPELAELADTLRELAEYEAERIVESGAGLA